MIDHVAYSVPDVQHPDIDELMGLLGYHEFQADEAYEAAFMRGQYTARWFSNSGECDLHIVQGQSGFFHIPACTGLNHFCVMVGHRRWDDCRLSRLCVRDSGSGRLWLEACGLRVEVHP